MVQVKYLSLPLSAITPYNPHMQEENTTWLHEALPGLLDLVDSNWLCEEPRVLLPSSPTRSPRGPPYPGGSTQVLADRVEHLNTFCQAHLARVHRRIVYF